MKHTVMYLPGNNTPLPFTQLVVDFFWKALDCCCIYPSQHRDNHLSLIHYSNTKPDNQVRASDGAGRWPISLSMSRNLWTLHQTLKSQMA